ncbi:RNA-directed DNA polymerase, eukaryota [Tanacetum coccineum]
MNFNSEGESDKEEVQETIFSSHKVESKGRDDINDDDDVLISDDPFKIYDLLEKQKLQGNNVEDEISNGSLNYPPGFTPIEEGDKKFDKVDKLNGKEQGYTENANEQVNNVEEKSNKGMSSSKEEDKESRCSGHFRRVEGPKTGGSILQLLDDVVKVGQTMGYKMDGCVSNIEEIIKSRGENDPSVGNSGGILCVWDPRMFRKQNSTVSDYFVAIQGVWIPNAKKCLIISVYAPQEVSEKKMLWSYLNHVIDNWSGETIIMGDFNEVRSKEERYGSIFNDHYASLFNSFISSGGLVEVPLGGCAFTWCHKSGNKMSKLDRFLISEGLMGMCPNISAITLDRYLSDHRPILLREVCHDYGPIPFRVFHYWFEWEGFDELVKDTWSKSTITDNNAISKFMNVDQMLLNKRLQVMNSLHDFGKLESMEIAQKAKIKWSIEGDENSKYFHGILNKKRNQTAIRGILAEGVWIDDPNSVKNEFLSHFKERFDRPCLSRLILDMTYPNRLNLDQIDDLERNVTKEEIKRAVWDCGTDKSPGPDGFTFGFYRRYWDIMEKDVVDAVSFFFTEGMFPKGRNASFIALIPKIQDAKVVKDFRPISLIGSLYKIIAKILANRLVMVLGDLVSEVQSAFIANRQILDGPFILNELIQWCKSKKKVTYSLQGKESIKAWDQQDLKWIESNIIIIVHALDCFHKASGLRMNLQKSKLLGIAVEDEKVSRAAMKMGCCALKTPFSYLSIKKLKTLSIGGRLTVLKSVLGSTPIYYMSMFKVPSQVLKCLEDIRRQFFNGADPKEKKTSWVKWSRVLASKDKGGLGMDLLSFMKKKVGDGQDTFFWEEVWMGDMTFKSRFPRVYALESDKKITVAAKMNHNVLGFSLRRAPRDGVEMEQLRDMIAILEGVKLPAMHNRWIWSLVGSGEFSVASTRKFIDDHRLTGSPHKT